MSDLSSAAKANLEAARQSDGKFGTQPHSNPGQLSGLTEEQPRYSAEAQRQLGAFAGNPHPYDDLVVAAERFVDPGYRPRTLADSLNESADVAERVFGEDDWGVDFGNSASSVQESDTECEVTRVLAFDDGGSLVQHMTSTGENYFTARLLGPREAQQTAAARAARANASLYQSGSRGAQIVRHTDAASLYDAPAEKGSAMQLIEDKIAFAGGFHPGEDYDRDSVDAYLYESRAVDAAVQADALRRTLSGAERDAFEDRLAAAVLDVEDRIGTDDLSAAVRQFRTNPDGSRMYPDERRFDEVYASL